MIPFVYRDWMDPFVLEHWAFGLIARSIASGHGFGSPFAETGASALLPPVYSYLLAGIFKVFGIETKASILAALSLNSLFSALTCVPVFLLARQAFGDRVAKWAGWGWAFSPYGIYYGADWAWSTRLVTLELAWLFFFAWRLEDSSRTRDWILFGLFGGFAALTEPVILSVVPLLGLWTIYRRYSRIGPGKLPCSRPRLRRWPSCPRGSCATTNCSIDSFRCAAASDSNSTSATTDTPNAGSTAACIPNHNDAELSEYERKGEMAYMDHKLQQGKAYIRTHPGWFARMTFRRFVYMWTGYWSLDRAYLKDEPLDPPNIFLDTSMSVLALLGLWRLFKWNSPLAARFAIVLLVFPLPYYISHPETYYFRPVDPLIVILAAVTVAGASWTRRQAAAVAMTSPS